MSSKHALPTVSGREYAAAYAIHYAQHDLPAALEAYDQVIVQHPSAREADYARAQLRNIIRSVIPADELLAMEVKLAHEVLLRAASSPE